VRRLGGADVARLLASWALSFLALLLTAELLPGFTYESWWPLAAAAAVTGLVGMIVRPVLVQLSAIIGWFAVALAAVFGQALVMQLALTLVPGAGFDSFWTAVAAAWINAAFGTFLAWIMSAGTDESFVAGLLRIRPGAVPDADVDGVLFVQLDGVSFPVMEWALQSGTMPTLRRWVDTRSHVLHEWTVQLPCTTPASQQALLQGTADGVPAFRWYDRELGRVLVANRPQDAAIIEARASNGHGLLADDGVSISNIFTGDAPKAAMTMSRLEATRGSRRTRQVVARFLLRPDGLSRSLYRTLAEIFRERFQAVRQERLGVYPRVHRSWTFAALRAFSNGLLRDLNTAMVAEEMMRGARSIYVDYVDYDEVAHHAGATRIESLSALTGLDRVLAALEKVAEKAPRHYHLVLLSDHGQAQGEPFASRHGTDLSALCEALTLSETTGVEGSVEGWGRVDSVLEDLSGDGPSGVAQAAARHVDQRISPAESGAAAELIVLGSGNLGLVYVPGPQRLTLEEIEARWPALVPGLAAHPGIGFVAALGAGGPVAIGATGRHHLSSGVVDGDDPLLPFGDHAPGMLLSATLMARAPELYVNSAVDPGTLDVGAFEPLVGCHGGLGGWQDRGFVLTPSRLAPDEPIVGGEQLHRHLVGILESLGHRTDLARSSP
jgi:uncharacterized membrane protein YvlD (DUF360 family)